MPGELVWPIRKSFRRKQKFRVVGKRGPNEPALLPCKGKCSVYEEVWTKHRCDDGNSFYVCTICGSRRQWGLLDRPRSWPWH